MYECHFADAVNDLGILDATLKLRGPYTIIMQRTACCADRGEGKYCGGNRHDIYMRPFNFNDKETRFFFSGVAGWILTTRKNTFWNLSLFDQNFPKKRGKTTQKKTHTQK